MFNNMNKLGRNDPCWCGSGKKYKKCHLGKDNDRELCSEAPVDDGSFYVVSPSIKKGNVTPMRVVPVNIPHPIYATTGKGEGKGRKQTILNDAELAIMRETCRAARRVLEKGLAAVKPGITTDEIDLVVHEACIAEGAYPSPLNYHGFPKSVCVSVNEVICHGIPDDSPLREGDIVNVDVTIYLNGFHGDCSETVAVGAINNGSQALIDTTRECLNIGISAAKPGNRIRDIGRAIQVHAHNHGYSVVQAYCGHGIGKTFHADPVIPHFYDRKERGKIKPGMIFTIEPMISMGEWDHKVWDDGWTAVTIDNKRSAQFENTILITEDGAEILTKL